MEESRNVLFIPASPGWGGGEVYVCELMESLERGGEWRPWAATPSRSSETLLGRLRAAVPEERIFRLPLRGMFDIVSIAGLRRIIRRNDIAVIHTNKFADTFVALFARMLSGRMPRIVMTRHQVKRAKRSPLRNMLYRGVDRIIFVSGLALDEFRSSDPKIERSKTVVVHNSITDYDGAPPIDLRAQYGVGPHTALLCFTGRIVEEKGVETLIEAAAGIRDLDFKLLVVGIGSADYTARLAELVAMHGLEDKVVFTGFRNDVKRMLRSGVDIGVAPSVWPEPFGLVLLEFMQAGVALVTTDNGAQPEFIVDGVTGSMVPPADPKALAGALRQLVENPAERRRLGDNGREEFDRNLSYDKFLKRITSLYEH